MVRKIWKTTFWAGLGKNPLHSQKFASSYTLSLFLDGEGLLSILS